MAMMRLNDASGGKMPTGVINLRLPDDSVVDVVKLADDDLRQIRGNAISMIFQEPMTSLNPVYTVGFQIAEAIMLHQGLNEKEAEGKALEMLQLVRIPEPEKQLKQYPHHLSGGMRQRVMIAMALSCRPQLLIADEPTTALDVTIQAQILDLIKTLQDEIGMAVLFITHDMGVVAEVADRVVVMFKGHIVEQGDAETIFHRPEHPYTRALIDAVPRLGSMTGKDAPEKFPNVGQTDTFKPEDFSSAGASS
jgi:ABC-type dipeptide/oligopeptide/nickel transport system ATPase component